VRVATQPAPAKHPLSPASLPPTELGHAATLTCGHCGADFDTQPDQIAGACPFCQAPYVATRAYGASPTPDAVIPATVDNDRAQEAARTWIRSRRFAPNALRRLADTPVLSLSLEPLWVFDAESLSEYTGERGVKRQLSGEQTESQIDWTRVSGNAQVALRDVAVSASTGTVTDEPWSWSDARSYADELLVGTIATAASVPLRDAWPAALQEMDDRIREVVRGHIGGDDQQISSLKTEYHALGGAYMLAASWDSSYQFDGIRYTLSVAADTGEVRGERPYSAVKIFLAVYGFWVAVLAVPTVLVLISVLSGHP
jgi:hypothetical protein